MKSIKETFLISFQVIINIKGQWELERALDRFSSLAKGNNIAQTKLTY
jgi:hypothetical protein